MRLQYAVAYKHAFVFKGLLCLWWVIWNNEKQNVVAWSNVGPEYWVITMVTSKLTQGTKLHYELRFGNIDQMKMDCDNHVTVHIASNPVFHIRTKHIAIDSHYLSGNFSLSKYQLSLSILVIRFKMFSQVSLRSKDRVHWWIWFVITSCIL